MRRAAQDPRARVMVLFLDPRFVAAEGSVKIRGPLIDALNRLIGGGRSDRGDDARRCQRATSPSRDELAASSSCWQGSGERKDGPARGSGRVPVRSLLRPAGYLRRNAYCARDDRSPPRDADAECPGRPLEHLRGLREERKAVITVSDGWPLYGPIATWPGHFDPKTDGVITGGQTQFRFRQLAAIRAQDARTPRHIAGTMISNDGIVSIGLPKCENDRHDAVRAQPRQRFITMMQSANRANVSFYPVDPGPAVLSDPLR